MPASRAIALPQRALLLLLTVLSLAACLLVAPAHPAFAVDGRDDYPYRADTSGSSDPWGFTKRQCVSFVAWRMKTHNKALSNSAQHWGSALTWDDAARRMGVVVSTKPKVGAIAQWNSSESSPYYANGSQTPNGRITAGKNGHVGYVQQVYSDGSARVEQYNGSGSRTYSIVRVKAPRYIYWLS